jgi:uncharacterized flavoprotein (TIGR03862 family)
MTKTVIVVGAGPAGLSAAECLSQAGVKTHIYERMASPARKFLLAGRGGLNLTHSEEDIRFIGRYGDAADRIAPFLHAFGPQSLREWCAGLGQDTFVGSSGRVFPKSFKASPLLRAWLRRLAELSVEIHLRHQFTGFEGRTACFETPDGRRTVEADAFVLALGGGSWPRLGSDGGWVEPLRTIGLDSTPLVPSNCGLIVNWSSAIVDRFEGFPLKNIRLVVGEESKRGECILTRRGLEGGAVYALSHEVGRRLRAGDPPNVKIDLKPEHTIEMLVSRLSRPRGKNSLSNFLRKTINLDPVAIALLRECGETPTDPARLAVLIKSLPLAVRGVAGLDRAISTAGGVIWDALDENLMAKAFPGLFLAGEMIDWDAPTGGYLLTACFSTGRAAGAGALQWLRTSGSR